MLGRLTIGTKLLGSMVIVAVTGAVIGVFGLRGIGQIDRQAEIVALEEMPLVDAAMKMKLSVVSGVNALERFINATTVVDTSDAAALARLEGYWQSTIEEFDAYAMAIVNGGEVNDREVIATDNDGLRELIAQVDETHNEKLQVAANRLMSVGRAMLATKEARNTAMKAMEAAYETLSVTLDRVGHHLEEGLTGQEYIPVENVAWRDQISVVKRATAEARIRVEEYVQRVSATELAALEKEFQSNLDEGDRALQGLVSGTQWNGSKIPPLKDPTLEEEFRTVRGVHDDFQAAAATLFTNQRELVNALDTLAGAKREVKAAVAKASSLLTQVEELSGDEVAKAISTADAVGAQAFKLLAVLTVCGLAFGIGIGLFLSRAITRPLGRMTRAAASIASGDIDQSIDHRSGDELGSLADSFRDMVAYMKGLATAADALGQGDLTARVASRGERDILGHSLRGLFETVSALFDETGRLVQAARHGELDKRGDAHRFQGSYRELVQGINDTLDAVIGPVRDAAAVLQKMASGDLMARVIGDYQGDHATIKEAVNTAVASSAEAIGAVRDASNQVTESTVEIATGNQDLATRTEEQAASLQETAAAMEQMAATAKASSGSADRAIELSAAACKVADEGGDVVGRAVTAMAEINQASSRIKEIIEVIDEIAFQTNLLSLNAAVEAARAGEHGRGFAVVASEVRNLARRSAKAAQEIKALINDSVAKVEAGAELVNASGISLRGILDSVRQVSGIIDDLANASRDQARGIDSVNVAIGQMNQITQQNAALVEEVAASAESLNDRAREMQRQVARFQLDGDNGRGADLPGRQGHSASRPHPSEPAIVTTGAVVAGEGDDEWEDF